MGMVPWLIGHQKQKTNVLQHGQHFVSLHFIQVLYTLHAEIFVCMLEY